MNEQECLQRIIDILADNVYGMADSECPVDVDMDGVQTTAKEIVKVFQTVQKDTRSKREKSLDAEFERMGVKPRVYHFTKDVGPFRAITIVTEKYTWATIRYILNSYTNLVYPSTFHPATHLREGLVKREEIYGISICDKSDVFSKRDGRNRAKGRLLQHLLKEQQK